MRRKLIFVLVIFPLFLRGIGADPVDLVLAHLRSLEFEKAKLHIAQVAQKDLAQELTTLHDLLYFAGQRDSTFFSLGSHNRLQEASIPHVVQLLNKGYYALYYHKTKSDAFAFFYEALKMAKSQKNRVLQKAALQAVLEYYRIEIAQNSQHQERYLEEYKRLSSDEIDRLWGVLYQIIFTTKTLGSLEDEYYTLADELNAFENSMTIPASILPRIYFEKGLRMELGNRLAISRIYYEMAFNASESYPFHRETRFFSLIRLSGLAQKKKEFEEALQLVDKARVHINLADTLRGNYYLNLYSSYYLNDLGKHDSAYTLLKKAYVSGLQLDYRANALEVNRLNVILETQQSALENASLKQNKIWLIATVIILALLLTTSYFFYRSSQAKKKIVEKEKELQSQHIEKLLHDQENIELDAMLEGQEKERQRLGNDLHDHLGSILATLKLHFENLQTEIGPRGTAHLFSKTDKLLEEAYQKVRSLAHSKNTGVNAQEGLLPALRNLAAKVSILNKLNIYVEDYSMNQRLDNSLEITIFRMIQELITNVIKYASASEIIIYLTHHGDRINIMVEDNGIGFDISSIKAKEGLGLHAIQKRIENLGGQVTIDSTRQKGTTVILDIPIT
ncbi:sensor histidine kinase [Arenibacter sp. GZD96]|uniref:sensor histidine kinase n=1 Tax=Aurantibrevibacter litoralis TaxID=3106030 RepID=UPI002AFE053C|nr:sensor histidine kinase [Arenibacter sp. GZD-96]MEA1785813.1 sensor histidine kinase [Arenibacter sp. GZD-96]